MEDVYAEAARLRHRADQARDARIRAQHSLEQAQAAEEQAQAALKAEYGIAPQQAAELRAAIDRQITEHIQAADQALTGAGL